MLNKVQFIGFVGADPSVQTFSFGQKLASFRLATNESIKKDDKTFESRAVWHSIDCRNELAEYVENNVKKGDKIYVEGKLRYRTYTDAHKVEKTVAIIAAEKILMLQHKNSSCSSEEA